MNRLLRVVCWLRQHHDWGPWQVTRYTIDFDELTRICKRCGQKETMPSPRFKPFSPVSVKPPWKPAPHVKVRMKPKTAFEKKIWKEKEKPKDD